MADRPATEPEEILRAAVDSPGEGTLGELAMQAERVQGVLEKLDEDELRRSYATLARIVGGVEKGEDPDAGGAPLAALAAVLGRMGRPDGAPTRAETRIEGREAHGDTAKVRVSTSRPRSKLAEKTAADPLEGDEPSDLPMDDPAPASPPDPRAVLLDRPDRAVPLHALAETPALEGEMLLAPTLLRLLQGAAGSREARLMPAPHDAQARVVGVTPAALLSAALAEGRDEPPLGSITGALRREAETLGAIPAAPESEVALDPARTEGAEILVGPALRGILAQAAQLAAEVRGRSTAPGRKFALAALILTPEGRQAFADLGMIRGAPGGFFSDLAQWLSDWLTQDDARHDRVDWAAWFAANPLDPPEALAEGLDLRLPARLSVPDYAADDVARRRGAQGSMLEGDRLGVAADARALADLVCLQAARPPLAIGLFGPWGSGKSTFMRMIEEAAEANRETAARMRAAGAAPPFVETIAHVWFNAWHYLDANLWASLVSHIFRELHRLSRGASPEEARRMDYLVEKLASAAQAETAAREGVRAADASVDAAERRVAEADSRLDALRRQLAEAAPRALEDLLAEETRRELAALEGAGVPGPLRSFEQLRDLRRELSGMGGRLRLLGSAQRGQRLGRPPARHRAL